MGFDKDLIAINTVHLFKIDGKRFVGPDEDV